MKPLFQRNAAVVLGLGGVMLLIKIFDSLVAPEHVYPGRVAAFPWVEFALALGLGLSAAYFAARTEILRVLPPTRPGTALLRAGLVGGILGAALAGLDTWLRIGDINVGLPLAPLFYLWGAISQEILTHFAPAAIVVGIVSFFLPSARAQIIAFWIVALAMSGLAAAGMVSAFQNPDVPLAPLVASAPVFIGAAVFLIELALFAMLRTSGALAALTMRLGFYAIWHIAWPALTY